jgi:hypothetical protein
MKIRTGVYLMKDLWIKFRQKCLEKGVTYSEQVERLIKEWMEK